MHHDSQIEKASEEKIAKLMDKLTVNMSASPYCFVPFLILVLFFVDAYWSP
jgi:hypothetical protein